MMIGNNNNRKIFIYQACGTEIGFNKMDVDVTNLEFPLDGTNALVLPAKRKKEKKGTRQVDFFN